MNIANTDRSTRAIDFLMQCQEERNKKQIVLTQDHFKTVLVDELAKMMNEQKKGLNTELVEIHAATQFGKRLERALFGEGEDRNEKDN